MWVGVRRPYPQGQVCAAEAEVDRGFLTAMSADELEEQIYIVVGGGTVSV